MRPAALSRFIAVALKAVSALTFSCVMWRAGQFQATPANPARLSGFVTGVQGRDSSHVHNDAVAVKVGPAPPFSRVVQRTGQVHAAPANPAPSGFATGSRGRDSLKFCELKRPRGENRLSHAGPPRVGPVLPGMGGTVGRTETIVIGVVPDRTVKQKCDEVQCGDGYEALN